MTAAAETVGRLVAAYQAEADPAAGAAMSAYMRNLFPFVGIRMGPRRAIDRGVRRGSLLPEADVLAVAAACWELPEREYQYFACDELRRHARVLTPDALPAIGTLITTKSWWDTVDSLAESTVGTVVKGHPETRATMDEWLRSDNLWLARSALLHQLHWKSETDADWLFAGCLRWAEEKDFFIRKAIGWVLREYSKTDEAAVRRFVAEHSGSLSGLSRREALKWLDRRADRRRDER